MQRKTDLTIPARTFEAIIFDLDGVIIDTASVHAAAWKRMFDALLLRRAAREGTPFKPFAVHGFDIAGPEDLQAEHTVGEVFLPVLATAEKALSVQLKFYL